MALPGECVNASHTVCIECGTELPLKVCPGAAGYYIGFFLAIGSDQANILDFYLLM